MENLGLVKGDLKLIEYDENYPKIFNELKHELLEIFKEKIYSIDHVGSTSIIGIKAKPIIDILIQTQNLDDFINYTENYVKNDKFTTKIDFDKNQGYLIRVEENSFVKAFIHVYEKNDINALNMINFRDYLNSHVDEKLNYENLKEELFIKYKDNRKEYTLGKNNFIKEIINKQNLENNNN